MNETIEGKNPVAEALKAKREINKIVIADASYDQAIHSILSMAKESKIPVQRVKRIALNRLATTKHHQGVVAFVAAKEYATIEDIIKRQSRSGQPLIIMVDGIEDPHNLGAIIRTAEAVGAQGVVIPRRRNVGLTEVVSKSSAGAIEHLPVARVTNLVMTIGELKQSGFWVLGCDAKGEKSIYAADLTLPLVLVVGGEGKGLSRLVKQSCDLLVRLPMLGKIDSLNASVAASVCLYEILRQRS